MKTMRRLTFALLLVSLAGGACDFAPICPPNSTYDSTIRRCRVLDAGPDEPPPPRPDAGIDSGTDVDAGDVADAGPGDAGPGDAGSDAGPPDAAIDSGPGGGP